MDFWTQAGLLGLGFCVGMVGTVMGVGGGFFMVPFLMIGMGFSHPLATGTSLAIIFVSGVSGSFTYFLRKQIRLKLGTILALAIIPGAFLGRHVVDKIDPLHFKILFSVFLFFVTIFFMLKKGADRTPAAGSSEGQFNLIMFIPVTFLIGIVTTLVGVGGGIVLTPLLVLKMPVYNAVATAYYILTWNSFAASLASWNLGQLSLETVLFMGIGGILGAQIGARFVSRVRSAMIKNLLLGVLLVLTATLMYDSVSAWLHFKD